MRRTSQAHLQNSSLRDQLEDPTVLTPRNILDKRTAAQEQAVVPPGEEELLGVRIEDTNDDGRSKEEMASR